MKKLFITITATILITPISTHAACTATPDCATLGYTKTSADCPDGGIKCPFDTTKMFCSVSNDSECAVGSILYSDMSCSYSKISGKTPIGIVCHVAGTTRLAISLVREKKPWAQYNDNVPTIADLSSTNKLKDFSGKEKTMAWVNYYGANSSYAPGYCYNYTTPGTKQGDWYLPALGELIAAMGTNITHVSAALERAGGDIIFTKNSSSETYWSSSEADSYWQYMIYNTHASFPPISSATMYSKTQVAFTICFLSF